MDFQFPAGAGAGGHHCPPLPNLADGGHHRPPFPDPAGGGGHHRHLLPIPTASAGNHRAPLPNTAAAYFPAPMHGFPGDDAARKLRKTQIRAEILARESDESRLLEEEVRRELYFERGMAERLREVERLGLWTPPPGKEMPQREIEGSIGSSLRQLQSFGLMLPSPAVEPIQALNYMDFWPGNMPSHPISHHPEAWVGEMPPPDANPQVGERSPPDANYHPIEAWVGERSPPDANLHSLDARVGAKQPPYAEIGETLPFPLNNLTDVGLALRPPRDSDNGEQHESETVPKPKRARATKGKLAKAKIKRMSGQKASATSGNCFQCRQPGHRRANCPASEEGANYKVSQQIDTNDMNCPASEEVANYKVSQQIDENDTVEEDGGVNGKCSRCGQSGHSRANCLASEEEAEWYKITLESSDIDEVEVSEEHAPPANNNCFHCGEVGHQRANCPLSREAKKQKKIHQMRRSNKVAEHNPYAFGASNLICHGCGKIGHMMRECRFLKKQIRRAERVENMKHKVNGVDPAPGFAGKCFICGRSGHLHKQCPARFEDFGVDPAPGFACKCFICGRSGHLHKQCPARFEDSYLKMMNEKKERKKKKAGLIRHLTGETVKDVAIAAPFPPTGETVKDVAIAAPFPP